MGTGGGTEKAVGAGKFGTTVQEFAGIGFIGGVAVVRVLVVDKMMMMVEVVQVVVGVAMKVDRSGCVGADGRDQRFLVGVFRLKLMGWWWLCLILLRQDDVMWRLLFVLRIVVECCCGGGERLLINDLSGLNNGRLKFDGRRGRNLFHSLLMLLAQILLVEVDNAAAGSGRCR